MRWRLGRSAGVADRVAVAAPAVGVAQAAVAVAVAVTAGWLAGSGSALAAERGVPKALAPHVVSCEDGALLAAPFGRLVNNMWNRRSAGAGDWRQCLLSRPAANGGGAPQVGWWWRWPWRDGLYAFPQLMVGHSPWRAEALAATRADRRFPRRIDDTRRLLLAYDVTVQSSGRQNLATDLWITDRLPAAGAAPDPATIKAELMVWTHASPGLVDPLDKPLATIMVGGVPWTVYVKKGWGDASGGSPHAWTLISYHSAADLLRVRVDAKAFLDDAVGRGLLAPSDYLWGVELGNEIVSGSGVTWINEFSVTVD